MKPDRRTWIFEGALVGAIVITVVIGLRGGWSGGPGPEDFVLSAAFNSDQDLWMRKVVGMHPDTWILRRRSGGWQRVSSIGDLSGRVKISTAEEAMDFARLTTSPVAKFCFAPEGDSFEITPRSALTLRRFFGSDRYLGEFRQYEEGQAGVVSDAWFRSSHVPLACVHKLGSGDWLVDRPIVRTVGKAGFESVYAHEVIKPDGTYNVAYTPLKLADSPKGGWIGMWADE